MKLYSYWRSSAAYRVRIALNLKRLPYDIESVSLLPGVAAHRQADYRDRNPQMLVPFLEDGELGIAQSMAILEYLEENYPERALLPAAEPRRSRVRAFCNLIACDIHPLDNLRVMQFIKAELGADPMDKWYAHWIHEGFRAAEQLVGSGPYCFGEEVTLADALLVPQVYNARRFDVALDDYPKLIAITNACNELPEFQAAAPESQPDCTH